MFDNRDQLKQLSPEALRMRLQRLERLLDVTRSVALEIDLEKILSTITGQACHALDCERASLYQFDAQREELFTRVVTELEINEIRQPLGQGITGHVAQSRQVANVADPAADPRWNSSIDRQTGFRTRNILAAPLVSADGGELLGVLQLLNKRAGGFDDLDEELIAAFGQHAAVALERAHLVEQLRRRQQSEFALNMARDIQRAFIPSSLPQTAGYEIAVWCYPNAAVGGDYCDVMPMSDGRLGLVVADVSGHGLGPSLIMASVRAAFRALLMDRTNPQDLLEALGRSLAYDLVDGRFVTMVVAELDPVSHGLRFANAGHAPALHFSASKRRFASLEATGLPLGVLDDAAFPEGPPIDLQPGDILFLCTDGIVEAANDQQEPFGTPRLQGLIEQHSDTPAENLVQVVASDLRAHIMGRMPDDDLTILAVRRT